MPKRRCLGLPGEPCNTLTTSTRCPTHTRAKDRQRGTRQQRGYGYAHQKQREEFIANLPLLCGYCGAPIYSPAALDTAHRVDGQPELGYIPAHKVCNQRAKRR